MKYKKGDNIEFHPTSWNLGHTIEVMKGNYIDIEDYDHLQAISLNAMFIYYQLTHANRTDTNDNLY